MKTLKSSFMAGVAAAAFAIFAGACAPKAGQDYDLTGQVVTTAEDIALAEQIMDTLKGVEALPGEKMIMAGTRLLGMPYVAHTLDGAPTEQLTIYLAKTDCILFVETCFNLALTASQGHTDFNSFANNVLRTRYREGLPGSFANRIHYTSEWIRKAEARGVVRDITMELAGEVYDHPISYMTAHSDRYPALVEHPEYVPEIKAAEEALNKLPYTYIPTEKIPGIEDKICNGDIICYVDSTEGLDIAHVTMGYRRPDGRAGFMHASMGKMQVVIDEKPIYEYDLASKGIVGIKVVRPTF